MLKVLHVITSLNQGGAETALMRLMLHEEKSVFASEAFSLIGDGPVARRMRQLGLETLNCESAQRPLGASLFALVRHCQRTRPDVIQGWMYHGNLAATLAAKAANVRRHGWNVRCSPDTRLEKKWQTRTTVRIGARLSPTPDWIIYNSHRAAEEHRARGFDGLRATVIPNGFDCNALAPDAGLRATLRAQLALSPEHVVVGTLARWHPQKDYPNLIRAAAEVCRRFPQSRFVAMGREVEWANLELRGQIEDLGLREHFHLLGEVPDAAGRAAMFDVNVLASAYGEGFPNAVAEGMACGIPCVGTDVGDTARIIGTTGQVVPPSDWRVLADAICKLIALPNEERLRLGTAARDRVVNEFSMQRNLAAYAELFSRVQA